jgi:hypothetical protein
MTTATVSRGEGETVETGGGERLDRAWMRRIVRFTDGRTTGGTTSQRQATLMSAFRIPGEPRPGRPVNLSPRVPTQMGWREMEHKGETRLVLSRTGGVLVVGVTSVRARERVSLFVSSFPRATSLMKALDLSFIDARRGSRCTMRV